MLARLAFLGSKIAITVSNVFSTTLYVGTAGVQSIVTGINLSGNDGLVWIKNRVNSQDFYLIDTVRGAGNGLLSDGTTQSTSCAAFTGFLSNGFSLGASSPSTVNGNTLNHVSWSFRKAPKFFDVRTFTHVNGTTSTTDLSDLGSIGMVFLKRTDAAGTWYAWHSGLSAGNNLHLETTAAQSASGAYLSVSGTTASFSGVAAAGTYVMYAFAHDSASDGMIQCGSFSSNVSGVGTFDPGWANGAQFVMAKKISATGNWEMMDIARTPAWTGNEAISSANLAAAETTAARLSASGSVITVSGLSASSTYVYMAIAAP